MTESAEEEQQVESASTEEKQSQDAPNGRHESHYQNLLKRYRSIGQLRRSDVRQPSFDRKPDWFDEELFNRAKAVYARHYMGVNFAHLSGLLLLVRVDSVYRTLIATGRSASVSKLFRRYYHTIIHVKKWYEGDIFEENSEAQRSLMIVRGMHNGVSANLNGRKSPSEIKINDYQQEETSELMSSEDLAVRANGSSQPNSSLHISQYDIMITQFAFVGLIVLRAANMGLISDFDARDLDGFLHFWRVIGHYLGVDDELNLCSHETKDIVGLCEAILETEFKDSVKKNPLGSPPGVMSLNIVRSVKFIPMLTYYGIMKYLYELIGVETSEIEDRRTCYSNMSYTFIKLVMSNLLGYRPLRAFNNGITRLSVHLVGKVEDWFAGRLDSCYGQELRL